MARLTVGQKADRVMKLMLALRDPRIAGALKAHGFTQASLAEGWTLLRGVCATSLDVDAEGTLNAGTLQRLDAWENKWFPIARATLKRHAPAVHDWLFLNLSQTEGLAVLLSVGTFVGRLDKMEKNEKEGGLGQAGIDAMKILAERGLTKEVIGEAGTMLAELGTIAGPLPDAAEEGAYDKAVDALWAWYLEWSSIARQTIKQRALLRQLGFLRKTASGKEVEVQDEEPDPAKPAG